MPYDLNKPFSANVSLIPPYQSDDEQIYRKSPHFVRFPVLKFKNFEKYFYWILKIYVFIHQLQYLQRDQNIMNRNCFPLVS